MPTLFWSLMIVTTSSSWWESKLWWSSTGWMWFIYCHNSLLVFSFPVHSIQPDSYIILHTLGSTSSTCDYCASFFFSYIILHDSWFVSWIILFSNPRWEKQPGVVCLVICNPVWIDLSQVCPYGRRLGGRGLDLGPWPKYGSCACRCLTCLRSQCL